MTDKETDYSPKLNNWFSPNIEYVGLGIARFTQPTGMIQGHTHVHFDEFGSCKIRMTVEKITFDDIEKVIFLSDCHTSLLGLSLEFALDNGGLSLRRKEINANH